MSNLVQSIYLLEDKLKNLLDKYTFLQEENDVLRKNNTHLHLLLQEKETQLIQQLQEYKLLKIAKTIEGSKENTKETKLKINALIREIDKCIVQLSQ